MLKIDIHTHILPEKIPDFAKKYGYGDFVKLDHYKPCRAKMILGGKSFREIEHNCWDPKIRIKECDSHNLQVQVLSTVPVMFNYFIKGQNNLDLSRFLNDHIANVVKDNPTRFIGLGTLPLQSPDLAIQELERCIKELGLLGVQIGTHVNDWNLDQQELFPVFKAAEKLGAAIFVHPWDMMAKEKMPKYWLPWLIGMPAEVSLAISSLIFGGVLEKLPKLRIAFAHGGGSFPATVGRINHGFNMRPDLCAIDNKVEPAHYLNKIYYDSLVHDQQTLQFLIDKVGISKVALGTDYPFPLGEINPGSLIDNMSFSTEQKSRLFNGTALEWLNVDANFFLR